MDIDKRIATEVMGWTQHNEDWMFDGKLEDWVDIWSPSTDITDAWLVVEKMRELGYAIRIENYVNQNIYEVYVYKNDTECTGVTREETAPKAISLAALEALGGK